MEVTIFNQLPEEIKGKIKPLEKDLVFKLTKQYEKTPIYQTTGGLAMYGAKTPVGGPSHLRKRWSITDEAGNVYTVGFVTGFKAKDEPIFERPVFANGQMTLSHKSQKDRLIYSMIQLYPGYRDSIFRDSSMEEEFYLYDSGRAAEEQLKQADIQDRALALYRNFKESEILGVGEYLGITGSKAEVKLSLRNMATNEPKRFLELESEIVNFKDRTTLGFAFEYSIVEIDHNRQVIITADDGKDVFKFDPNYAPENQRQAFIDTLIKDKDGAKLRARLIKAVEDYQTNLSGTDKLKSPKRRGEEVEL